MSISNTVLPFHLVLLLSLATGDHHDGDDPLAWLRFNRPATNNWKLNMYCAGTAFLESLDWTILCMETPAWPPSAVRGGWEVLTMLMLSCHVRYSTVAYYFYVELFCQVQYSTGYFMLIWSCHVRFSIVQVLTMLMLSCHVGYSTVAYYADVEPSCQVQYSYLLCWWGAIMSDTVQLLNNLMWSCFVKSSTVQVILCLCGAFMLGSL